MAVRRCRLHRFRARPLDDRRTPRGRTAQLLVLWLERTVFMPIDNRRTAETGKTYAFTRETARR